MPTYPNGAIPQSELRPIPAVGGNAWLLPGPAAAFHRLIADCERRYGWSPVVTSAGDGFRSLARQVAVFRQRYEPRATGRGPYGDVRWWRGVRYVRVRGAAAAVPGTSNHGKGITVDVSGLGAFTSTRFRQFSPLAELHGFSNAEGRSVREPWHWNYTRDAQAVVNTNTIPGVSVILPGGVLPGDLIERDGFDMAEVQEVVDALVKVLTPIIKREALAAVVEAVDDRQARDRKDMLEQAEKASREVVAEVRAIPERVWKHTPVPGVLGDPAGEAGYLVLDSRRAAVEGRNLMIQATGATSPAVTPPADTPPPGV